MNGNEVHLLKSLLAILKDNTISLANIWTPKYVTKSSKYVENV